MSMLSAFHNRIAYLVTASVVWIAGFFKIADLDFWWHLKTGQIILQEKEFQREEIYSFTAAGREYVDHEWLFQVFQFLAYDVAGPTGVIVLKCLVLTAIYFLIVSFLLRQQISLPLLLTVIILSICGARTRFIERPEIFTAFFLVSLYLLLNSYLITKKRSRLVWTIPLMVLWANIHAAVILGLVLASIFLCVTVLERFLKRGGYPTYYDVGNSTIWVLLILSIVLGAVTLINPTGYRVLTVPFELTSLIDSGLLNNQEWQQPPLFRLPFYYSCLFLTFGISLLSFRTLHWANFFLAAFLAYISLKYVRNVGLFCIFFPILIAPYLKALSEKLAKHRLILVPLGPALIVLLVYTSPFEFGLGISSHFPDQIVEFTKRNDLKGNLLNSYAFGGYLIWTIYPERKIFIDGRNEVYLPLLEEIVAVRGDGRLWKRFLEKYEIEYALLNYVDELEEVTVTDTKGQIMKTQAPFSSTHFSRKNWAMVYWDDDGMILVRRNGLNSHLASMEYTSIFPEGHYYHESLARAGRLDRTRAIFELQRKLKEDPNCKRAGHLLEKMQQMDARNR